MHLPPLGNLPAFSLRVIGGLTLAFGVGQFLLAAALEAEGGLYGTSDFDVGTAAMALSRYVLVGVSCFAAAAILKLIQRIEQCINQDASDTAADYPRDPAQAAPPPPPRQTRRQQMRARLASEREDLN